MKKSYHKTLPLFILSMLMLFGWTTTATAQGDCPFWILDCPDELDCENDKVIYVWNNILEDPVGDNNWGNGTYISIYGEGELGVDQFEFNKFEYDASSNTLILRTDNLCYDNGVYMPTATTKMSTGIGNCFYSNGLLTQSPFGVCICEVNIDDLGCPVGDPDMDDYINHHDDYPTDPCLPDMDRIACPTGDWDGDGIINAEDSDPSDTCIPEMDNLACPTGDFDMDGVPNNDDPYPASPCLPNMNSLACPNGDTDGDGIINAVDVDPSNPNIPGTTTVVTNLTCEELIQECPNEINDLVKDWLEPADACNQWEGECSTSGLIHRLGRVSIGTDFESDKYRLVVKGTITTEQFKVCKTYWCDYVFDADYPLMDLCEVEAYITEHCHLPNVPSAQEIEGEGGFELGATTQHQQEKIEEIFLHLLELDAQVEHLNTIINQE